MKTTITQVGVPEDVRPDRRLLTAGVTALAAAAIGSVLAASPAMSESPSTDDSCRIQIVGDQWYGSGCDDRGVRSAP
ncbi:hypothetical protein GCM10011376_25480 [Nocardioides flavus (ex Wang et al. 2016)]|uniref:Uncharacterized protein n=1 Tax=Nocardioides flavus (ex Wang et al. 2016) TaxID=2058780 RepID=A0ABQ3HJS9_9ACTN|nr:hypothetical protein [Nocardioides flavus (ex Wang et al. 2016)]GHE17938.1 hypothetical protein GCM10011376_25480 [Nocardioides flavus (ex Wang et al. 2016)]